MPNDTQIYVVFNTKLNKMEETKKQEENAQLGIGAIMPRFVYRLYERGKCRTYEIGELDNPRTSPKEWCDRRLCEGFWGDEESCKKVVYLLNGA